MNEKTAILMGIAVTTVVVLTIVIYAMNMATIGLTELASLIVIIILVLAATYLLWDRARNLKKGLPGQDERLTKINYKAGYYGFIAAIWTAVGAPVLADILLEHELEGYHVTAVVVLVSGVIFMLSYLVLARKGH